MMGGTQITMSASFLILSIRKKTSKVSSLQFSLFRRGSEWMKFQTVSCVCKTSCISSARIIEFERFGSTVSVFKAVIFVGEE